MTFAMFHGDAPDSWRDVPFHWSDDIFVWMLLLLSAWLYVRGIRQMWKRPANRQVIDKREIISYVSGWLVLLIALVSPLHPLSAVLFYVHMTQHELLMLIAAPLIVLGHPLIPFLWALPMRWRTRLGRISKNESFSSVWRMITLPFAAWALHAVAIWIWHIPALFEATLTSDLIHTLQHACFFGTALLFWWALFHGRQGLMGYGIAVLYVFTTALHTGLLGAILTFSSRLWFPTYVAAAARFGLTPHEDQQLAGLIMWVLAGFLYTFAGVILFVGWMREAERRASRQIAQWSNKEMYLKG